MKRLVIGVTGKIGSGKTIFCRYLEKKGCFFICMDDYVDLLYKKNQRGARLVEKHFGKDYLRNDGSVNRAKLRINFGDNRFLKYAEDLSVYLVEHIRDSILKADKTVIVEYIDFGNEHLRSLINKLVYIDCSLQKIEVRKRGFDEEFLQKAYKIQKKPLGIDEKIDNSGNKNELYIQADNFLKKYDIV